MTEFLDYAEIYLTHGLAALRDAIRSKGTNTMPEYDNSNRIALWQESDRVYLGYGEYDGHKVHRAAVIKPSKAGSGPIAHLVMSYGETSDVKTIEAAIWMRDNGKLGGSTETHWLNVFKNEVEQGSNKPHLTIKFSEKEELEKTSLSESRPPVTAAI
jgi:hypothetical protein